MFGRSVDTIKSNGICKVVNLILVEYILKLLYEDRNLIVKRTKMSEKCPSGFESLQWQSMGANVI